MNTARPRRPRGSFISVSAGAYHTCGVRSNGSVACWGSDYLDGDYYGQATAARRVPSSPSAPGLCTPAG